MNKKFVKENKKVLREFISNIVAAALGAKGLRDIDKVIDATPELKRKKAEINKSAQELTTRIKKFIEDNPQDAKRLKKKYSHYLKRYK